MAQELKDKLQKLFNADYPGTDTFINEVIRPIFGDEMTRPEGDVLERHNEYENRAKRDGIKHLVYVADITDNNLNSGNIVLIDATVADNVNLEHSRVKIQQLVRSMVPAYNHILMVFHYENPEGKLWRFSYAYKQETLSSATSAKRYTYVFGRDFRGWTAAERFVELKNSPKHNKDFEKAFSVQVLSDDFFNGYRDLYADFVKFITDKRYEKSGSKWIEKDYKHPNSQYETTFGKDDRLVRDYIKKLFGRIVFLYFLQRKGWMNGNRQYMHDLFALSDKKDDFLDGVLEPLFFEVLDTDIPYRSDAAKQLPGYENIPYLNGGLFAQDDIDRLECKFPQDYFERLFEFLDSYNFTIDENDSDDAEIGIDPEMLGRIFENLLEDNKDKGAYYTPKEIVDYMCRESLISYLQDERFSDNGNKQIRTFVESLSYEGLNITQREYLRDKLKAVKICDPAIGSGAFPMGLVNLLAKLYIALGVRSSDMVDIKRHIMMQNIYGVDIEKGAIDIARLRFWLAMIVEEKEPIPLPNLNFKIMQGNSLMESYGEIDLANLTKIKTSGSYLFDSENIERTNLVNDLNGFYRESDHTKRNNLFNKIIGNVRRQLNNKAIELPDGTDPSANSDFFLWHTWFSDVFAEGGFDIVIGNPPYGAKLSKTEKDFYKKHFVTAKKISGVQKGSVDTYTLFIEQGFNILKTGGSFAYIVPISLTSSDALTGVHKLLLDKCDNIRISSYAVRPKPVFENAFVNTSILLFSKTMTPCKSLKSTKMYRRGKKFDLKTLVDNLEYTEVKELTLKGRIPKIGLEIEKSILSTLFKHSRIGDIQSIGGSPIFYRFAGGRYFKVVTNYSTGSSAEASIYFESDELANAIGCILSSTLSFWFYQIFSDNLNWKSYEIENFTVPHLSEENLKVLNELYSRYLEDIEKNANVRNSNRPSQYKVDSFKEYKIVRSKAIIDEIDDYIGPLYGLSQEEIDFIKNYELEFRMAGE